MALPQHIGRGQTALLLSTYLTAETVVFVQARPHVTTIRSVSDLYTDFLVPRVASSHSRLLANSSSASQADYSHVFNMASQQITLTHMPFDPSSPLVTHFTILFRPQSSSSLLPIKNLVLQHFIGSNQVSWFGNLLVVAHTPDGTPLPFTPTCIDGVRYILTR